MSSTLIRLSALAALFTILCTFLVNAAPQLQFEDQQEVSNDGSPVEPLTRTRRGSQHYQQPQPSYGHHQPSYSPPSGYGHGSGGAGGAGGGSQGFAGQSGHGQSQGYGHSSGGHGHGHGGPVGPVFTFVRTDYHGNFQTGVRHKVGGGYGWRG